VVLKGDDVLVAQGYGVESVERPDAVMSGTVFELGSISKQFTAALILKLVEEKRLALDDPVARRLPDFTQLPAGLTIRHLLTHTSGMREVFAQPDLNAVLTKPGSSADEFETVARRSPADFAPGTRWSYSSLNYVMLTLIAERVAGQRLGDALSARFLRPLALSSIRQCPSHPGDGRGAARGHVPSGQAWVPHPPENFHLFVGAGGLCGSAVDVARWTRALATGKVVGAASFAQMSAPAPIGNGRTADYGMAMVLVSPDGTRRLGHGGYGGGFSAQAAYYPQSELTVVVMLNRFALAEVAERRIARRLLGLPEATVRDVSLSAEERQRYVGSYDIGVMGWYPTVAERDGKLWFEARPLPPQPLVYIGNGEFVREGQPYGYRLYFGPDSSGREVRILGMGMMSWYGVRRP
jgi:CubicO group peptidase (beta-lactamase class C family)